MVKFYILLLLDGSFLHQVDVVARGSSSLATCGGIFYGSMREFIGGFSASLMFKLLWLLSFMKLYRCY